MMTASPLVEADVRFIRSFKRSSGISIVVFIHTKLAYAESCNPFGRPSTHLIQSCHQPFRSDIPARCVLRASTTLQCQILREPLWVKRKNWVS
jgi:hypothetical protein